MKLELSERMLVEELFKQSNTKDKIKKIEKLTGDASTRRYYRAFGETESYVVCMDNPTKPNENTFVNVQKFLEMRGIRVPKILYFDISKGYILEEDLGDKTLLSKLSQVNNPGEELELYRKVVDELVKLHSTDQREIEKSNHFNEKFDYDKLMFEIDFCLKYFVKLFLGFTDEDSIQKLRGEFAAICKDLSSYKMVLTHRDFHSRNVMEKDNELVIIDFQDARMGIPQYDLASLLDDCYYDLERTNRYKLLQYYYEQMKDELTDNESFEVFFERYHAMAIQRLFKAVGSFAYIYNKRQDQRYVKYIGFAMEKIKKYMHTDPKYNELRKHLFGMYYEC